MKKLMLSIFSLMLVAAVLVTPVFAGGNNANLQEEKAEAVAEPRAATCTQCNVGALVYQYSEYGTKYYIGTIPYCKASGGTHHSDKVYSQIITKVYECNHCGVQDPVSTENITYACP